MGKLAGENQNPDAAGAKSFISIRASENFISEINRYASDAGVSRTVAIINAVDYYIHSKKCIHCGEINTPNGVSCAVCGSKLYSMDEIRNAAVSLADRDMYDIDSNISERIDKFESIGFSRIYHIKIDASVNDPEPMIWVSISLDDGEGMQLSEDDLDSFYIISSEMLRAELEKDTEKVIQLNEKRRAKEQEEIKRQLAADRAMYHLTHGLKKN